MSELVTMYPAQANSPETSLSGALTAAGTTVNVVDGSVLPEAPNLLTIGADGSTAETVLMTAKNGNVLTVTRAQNGTTARAWSAMTRMETSSRSSLPYFLPESRSTWRMIPWIRSVS